jgi:PmbA protein
VSEELERAARVAVEAALAAGADDAEGWAERSTRREVRVYEGEVESLTDATSRGLGVRAWAGGAVGHAFGTDLGEEGVAGVARAALEAARAVDADPCGGLPDDLGAASVPGLASSALRAWDTPRKVELALAVERAARGRRGVSQVEDTVYADGDDEVALVNSRGFAGGFERTTAWTYASAFAGEGAELMTGLGVGLGRDPDALDPAAVGSEAADRALALTGARQPRSRRCPVLLDPFVAASVLGVVGGMLSGEAVQRGRSLFAGKEGTQVASPLVTLVDDGLDPEGLASAPFDGEGSPRRRTALLRDGRLLTFLWDARAARRAGRASTASAGRGSYRFPPSLAPSNLVLETGPRGLPELLAEVGEGLYVADVTGLHSGVNPVSGTFSVGATGRLVRGGELAEPVREMTIAGDLLEMLRDVAEVGREARWIPFGGSVRSAPVLLGEMAVSGA